MTKTSSFKIHWLSMFFSVILCSTFILGCSSDIEQIENENSSFELGQIKSVSSLFDSGNELGEWNAIAYSNHLTMKACFLDNAIDGIPVRNEKFRVITINGESIARTDLEGCLTFNDNVSFNYLALEKYYSYPVIFEGLSNYKGRRTRELAINPWKKDEQAVQDLKYITTVDVSSERLNEAAYNSTHRTSARNFKVKDINIFLKSTNLNATLKTEQLKYEFSMSPYILRHSLEGLEKEIKVSKGQVKIQFTLFERPSDSSQFRVVTDSEQYYRFKDGNITGEIDMLLTKSNRLDSDGVLKLVMSVIPIKAPLNLGAEYAMTYMDNLNTNTKLDVQRVDEIDSHFRNLMNQNQVDNEIIEVDDDFGDIEDSEFGYMISEVEIKRGSIVSDNYNQGTKKKVRALIKICLVDPRSDNKTRPITHKIFKVTSSLGGDSQDKKTSSDGCLDMSVIMNFDKYDCEQFKKFKVSLEGIDGIYTDIKKDRILAINPWANDGPFGLDITREGIPDRLGCKAPQINIPNLSYSNEGNVIDSYRINSYLHLSFKKDFLFDFKLFAERFHSYSEEKSVEAITMGEYEATFILMSPIAKRIDYNNINLVDFEIFSAVKQNIKVSASGQVTTTVNFPLIVTDSYLLSYKNIVMVKIAPKDPESKLTPITVTAPFFGTGTGASMNTQKNDLEALSLLQKKDMNELIDKGHKLLNFKEDLFDSPINLYKTHYLHAAKEKDSKVYFVTLKELNELPRTGGQWIDRIVNKKEKNRITKEYIDKLNLVELKMLVTTNGIMPKVTLRKLCHYFFNIPEYKITRDMGQRSIQMPGSDFLSCINDPRAFLKTTPLQHMKKIIPSRIRKDGKVIGKKWATLVRQENGKVYRGDAFFAAQGNRYFKSWGEKSTTYRSAGLDLSPSIPYLLGMKAGTTYELAKYNGYDEGVMHMDYDRFFTQRTKLDLSFNAVTLRFRAQVQNCVSITSQKSFKTRIHLCEDQDQLLPRIEETWYFIGRTKTRENGILSDSNAKAFDNEHQLIRGTYNYNLIWDKFKGEDVLMVIGQMGTADLSGSYQKVLEGRPLAVPFENRSDNSFPGLIVPEKSN
ncbi:MAG: hypothetical protein HN576_13595 [Bacteriovoracaceae bacterium]|nr:hypothetical protein [Bacteriovoracaceae bacterium]